FILRVFADNKEVIISRGQLVEIGGGFRVPDVLSQSGARMVEVGTTNRTRPADFEQALSDKTGLLLRVHPSNFRVIGFTHEVTLAALQATLLHYLKEEAAQKIPVWQMISARPEALEARAAVWVEHWKKSGIEAEIVSTFSTVGGGSLPGETLPTRAAALKVP